MSYQSPGTVRTYIGKVTSCCSCFFQPSSVWMQMTEKPRIPGIYTKSVEQSAALPGLNYEPVYNHFLGKCWTHSKTRARDQTHRIMQRNGKRLWPGGSGASNPSATTHRDRAKALLAKKAVSVFPPFILVSFCWMRSKFTLSAKPQRSRIGHHQRGTQQA